MFDVKLNHFDLQIRSMVPQIPALDIGVELIQSHTINILHKKSH